MDITYEPVSQPTLPELELWWEELESTIAATDYWLESEHQRQLENRAEQGGE